MSTHIVMFTYPESDWGTDIVRFIFDDEMRLGTFKHALHDAQLKIEESDSHTLPDYTNAVCDEVIKVIGGTWRYLFVSCEVEVII